MISNCGHDENGNYRGGKAGDQTGNEWSVINWYNRPWNYVLRYPDENVRTVIADMAEKAAKNNAIGYNQATRTSFWYQLESCDYLPENIAVKCEADCSAGVAAIVKGTGYRCDIDALKKVPIDIYTGNERAALVVAGFKVLTESKYLTSDKYLKKGDILLYENHHTAINLTDGSQAKEEIEMKKSSDITGSELLRQCEAVCNEARTRSYAYGDSKSLPPCNDRKISCDRMVARALWNLGFTDQPIGGITVVNMESYLVNHGFEKITNANAVASGDIVLMAYDGESKATWRWHTFVVKSKNSNGTINKFDCGSQERIRTAQPFKNCALDEWSNKHFYSAFRVKNSASGKDAKIESGYYKIVSALGDEWVMDVNHGSVDKKANIQIYVDNGTDAQIFHLKRNTEKLWCICNKKSGKVFDIANGSKDKGGNLQQYPWNDTSAQKFYIKTTSKNGYYEIVNAGSGLALDVADGKAEKRRNIRQWRRNGTAAQMWKFVKV